MQHGCCIRAYKDVFTASLRECYIARNAPIYVEKKLERNHHRSTSKKSYGLVRSTRRHQLES